ncbi:MAG: hypothetical protein WAS73_11085 [Defluviicoccus sp.]
MSTPRSADDIVHESDNTRSRIHGILAALEERISFQSLVARSLTPAKEGATKLVSVLGRAVQENPLAFTITGVGVAWLMLSHNGDRSPHRKGYGIGWASATARRSFDEAYRWASEHARHAGSDGRSAVASGWAGVRARPVVSGLAVLGVGAAIAVMMAPRTRRAVGAQTECPWKPVAPGPSANDRDAPGAAISARAAAEEAAARAREAMVRMHWAAVVAADPNDPDGPASMPPPQPRAETGRPSPLLDEMPWLVGEVPSSPVVDESAQGEIGANDPKVRRRAAEAKRAPGRQSAGRQ